MSAEHANITFEGGEFMVRDAGSRNGLSVDVPIGFGDGLFDTTELGGGAADVAVPLRSGTRIRCGMACFAVRVYSSKYIFHVFELRRAVEAGDCKKVEQLYSNDQEIAPGHLMDGNTVCRLDGTSYLIFEGPQVEVGLESRPEFRLPATSYPLHVAVARGDIEMVKLLLKPDLCCDVNARTHPELTTPLHLGIRRGFTNIVHLLLDNGADISMVDTFGTTMESVPSASFDLARLLSSCVQLGHLALEGHLDKIEKLIEDEDPPLNARSIQGRTALALASINGHLKVVDWLLKQEVNPKLGARLARIDFDLAQNLPGSVTLETWQKTLESRPIHAAASHDHAGILRSLIKADADIHVPNRAGLKAIDLIRSEQCLKAVLPKFGGPLPMWLAAQCGVMNKQLLSEYKQDPSLAVSPTSHKHALQLAIENGHIDVLHKLITAGIRDLHPMCILTKKQPTITTGTAPLHIAAKCGYVAAVQCLLEARADPDCHDDNGKLPLDLCNKQLKELRWQSEWVAHTSRFSNHDSWKWDKKVDEYENVRSLLERPGTKLRDAIENDDPGMVHRLIMRGEVDTETLQKQYDVPSGSILFWAMRKRHIPLVKLLIANGVEVNTIDFEADLRTILHEATAQGHCQVVEQLLAHNADPDVRDAQLQTPLHFAATIGHGSIVSALLKGGADRTLEDDTGNRPFDVADTAEIQYSLAEGQDLLALAVLHEDEGALTQLLDAGICKVNSVVSKNKMAIHLAAASGSVHITRLLLEKGADINARGGFYEFTPLHYATYQGFEELVQFLVSKSADKGVLDTDGKTAYELAETEALRRALLQSPREIAAADNPFLDTVEPDGSKSRTSSPNNTEIPLADACKICLERKIEVILLPCGHQAFCFQCVQQLSSCALCRQPVKEVVKIYRA